MTLKSTKRGPSWVENFLTDYDIRFLAFIVGGIIVVHLIVYYLIAYCELS